MLITGSQIAVARALVGWSRAMLAVQAKVDVLRVSSVEVGLQTHTLENVDDCKTALEAARVEFDDTGGVRMREGKP
jgi:hypothetical protein